MSIIVFKTFTLSQIINLNANIFIRLLHSKIHVIRKSLSSKTVIFLTLINCFLYILLSNDPNALCLDRMPIPTQRPGAAEAEAAGLQSAAQWNQSGGCIDPHSADLTHSS